MVRFERTFEPDPHQHQLYSKWFELYRQLWPASAGYLRALASQTGAPPS
jgi:sugar (pentulose or hexulose) kinase